ncbi:unnamed protein product [Urochloa humidicola]
MRRCALLVLHLLAAGTAIVSARPAFTATTAASDAPGSVGAPDGVPEHLSCLEELLQCTAYLKASTHPSATCCTAMHNAAAAEMPCLCRLFVEPGILTTFNVTRDQMFRLPARCGLPVGCRPGPTPAHDPVVEAPPPPAGAHHHHGASSRSSEFWSVWRVVASVVFGQMLPMAAVF